MRVFLLLGIVLLFAFDAVPQKLKLSTDSDSALYYYYEGWRQVMDEGDYTAAEKIYRKMMASDPGFLVGLSLLGRITRNLQERLAITDQLEKGKKGIKGDERLLLDNYIELVKLTNLRETNPTAAKKQMDKAFKTGEKNLAKIVHRYPDDIYYKSEYVEVLHRNYGPRIALDTLYRLATQSQQQSPFLLGYAAHMEAELGRFDTALAKAKALAKYFEDTVSPKPHVVLGDIYFQMGELDEAEIAIDKALAVDPGNIDAQRLKKKIEDTGKEKP